MADSSYDIDSIVQKVMEAIRASGAGNAGSTDNTPTQSAKPRAAKPRAAQNGSQLTLTSRVVTIEQIAGRLEGVRQLVVPRQAVVTPSARDLLQEHNVVMNYAPGNKTNGTEKASAAGGPRLNLIAAVVEGAAGFDLDALARALAGDGIDVEQSASNCLIETTGRLAARFDDDAEELGAIVTSHPAAALCLANRLQGVRAVCPATTLDVLPAAKDVGANLIVIDPASRGVFQVKQMIREFCLSGRHTCPEVLAAQLG